jgi:hypothetical protein
MIADAKPKDCSEAMLKATINYAARTDYRQCYYANDHSRDTVVVGAQAMALTVGRGAELSLDREGFRLVSHVSAVRDFEDRDEVAAIHRSEVAALLHAESGADEVVMTAPGILRFSESSGRAGSLDNSMPARFVHIDSSAAASRGMAEASLPAGRTMRRYAHFNVWRSFSGAPQDVPLAVCAADSVAAADLISADAIFDPPGGGAEWSFESWLVAHNPAHRWHWFPDMTRDEALIFKTSDSQFANPVPHVAFDNPLAPAGCHPRASIEMRGIAYWYA